MAEAELPNPEELRHHRADTFARGVALTTAIFAVMLALAALGGNHAMKEMLLSQQQASDQWAFFQAKSIREHQYRAQKLRLEVDLIERGSSITAEARQQLEELMKRFGVEEKRYSDEKKDIEKHAKQKEHERDRWQARDPYFLLAEALLQIAIVLSSVSILARSRLVFGVSLCLAGLGALLTLNGYLFVVQTSLFPGH